MNVPRRFSSLVLLASVAAAACPSLAGTEATPVVAAESAAPGPAALAPASAEAKPAPANGAQPAAPAAKAENAPAVAAAGDPRDFLLPEVDFNNIPVEDVIQFLQDASGGRFRAVVVHRGVRQGPPVTMRLRNVALGQVLDVLTTAYEGIEMQAVDGPTGQVNVVTLRPARPAGADGGAGAAAEDAGAGDRAAVRVYRLTGIIAALGGNEGGGMGGGGGGGGGLFNGNAKEVEEQRRAAQLALAAAEAEAKKHATAALNNVLSLVKATLQLIEGAEPPTIQVHEETQTLIFRGTPRQQAAIEDVLTALESPKAVRPAGPSEQADRRLRQATAATEQARKEAAANRDEGAKRLDRLELELQAMNAKLRDREATLSEAMGSLSDAKTKLGALRDRGVNVDNTARVPDATTATLLKTAGEFRLTIKSLEAQLGKNHASVVSRRRELAIVLEETIPAATTYYGKDHPTVVALQKELEEIKAQLGTPRDK